MSWRYVESTASSGPFLLRLGSVLRHRQLLRRMAERDLRQRYVGSALGFAWAVLNPLLFVSIYAVIFTFIFGGRLSPGAPTALYALYVVTGLLPWVSFSEVATRATQAMGEYRNLVKYVVFPVQILPLTSLYATAFSQAVGLVAVLLFAAVVRGGLDAALLLLPVVLGLQFAFLAGVAWLLGAVGAVFRDVKEILQVLLMVGMFLTPIFYVESVLPRPMRLIIALNPLTHLVRLYRDALMGTGIQHPESLAVFAVLSLVLLPLGFLAFERTRLFLSDIL